jgi:Ca-activated chloride channel family protein
MFRFENPHYLYALIALPLMVIFFLLVRRLKKNALKRFGEQQLMNRLLPYLSWKRQSFKFILFAIAWMFLVIAIANPQLGSKLAKVQHKGIDLMICLDVSNSMLAEDIAPNRLENAKLAISKLIDNLKGDRIGIVIFAGKGYVQLPITSDYAAAKLFLSTIRPELVPTQGTAIAEALALAGEAFIDEKHNKAVVLITDGEDHEGNAVEETAKLAEKGVRVFTIGIGSPEGSPIPDVVNGNVTGFKKDNEGNTIVTKLNETILQQIASAGSGIYVRSGSTQTSLKKVLEETNKIEKSEFDAKLYSDYENRFYYFIWPAFILLILEVMLSERKSKWLSNIKIFERAKQ